MSTIEVFKEAEPADGDCPPGSVILFGDSTANEMRAKDGNTKLVVALGDDKKVKVSEDDTTPGYFDTKFQAGTNMSIVILNPGADEIMEISSSALSLDHNDLTAKQGGTSGEYYHLTVAQVATVDLVAYIDIDVATSYNFKLDMLTKAAYAGTGTYNVALGSDSFKSTTSGSYNVSIGYQNLISTALTGNYNVAIGNKAGKNISSGTGNTCLGDNSGINLSTGSNNVFIGTSAGTGLSSGINNICIGKSAAPSSGGVDYEGTFGGSTLTNFRIPGIGFNVTADELNTTAQINTAVGTTTKAAINFANATALKITPVDGDMEYHNGHLYLTAQGVRHALNSSVGIKTATTTVSNTTTETTFYSYTVSANELHLDERIVITCDGVFSNASASDDFTIRFKFGGTTLHTITRTGGNVTDEGWEATYKGTIRSIGVSGKFVDYTRYVDGSGVYSDADTTEHSIDTTGSGTVEITIQWGAAKAGNTFSCTQGDMTIKH